MWRVCFCSPWRVEQIFGYSTLWTPASVNENMCRGTYIRFRTYYVIVALLVCCSPGGGDGGMQSCTRVGLTRTCRRAAWKRKPTRSHPRSCEQISSKAVEHGLRLAAAAAPAAGAVAVFSFLLVLLRSWLHTRRRVRRNDGRKLEARRAMLWRVVAFRSL